MLGKTLFQNMPVLNVAMLAKWASDFLHFLNINFTKIRKKEKLPKFFMTKLKGKVRPEIDPNFY